MAVDENIKASVAETAVSDTSRLDKDSLLKKLKDWYKADLPRVIDWREQAREDYAFYNGEQWSDADKSALTEQKRPIMTFNRVAPLVNAVIGAEINNRREVRYIPREMGDAEANELLTNAAEWFRDEAGAEDEDSDAFEDNVICGMGWTDTRLDFELDPDGAPVVRRLDPLKFVWDASAVKPNLEDAQHLFYVDEKPLSEWMAIFPDADPEVLNAAWAKSGNTAATHDNDEPSYEGGSYDENPNKLCTIVEARWLETEHYYRAQDPQSGQMLELDKEQAKQASAAGIKVAKQSRKVVRRAFIGNGIIGDIDAPLVPSGMFGWECITGYRDKIKRQFYGVVRPTKDPQRWANKFFSQVMFLLNSQSKGGIIAERGAFEDDRQAEESWAKADSITWAKNGGTSRIQPKPTAQFPTGFFALFNEAKEAINQVTGLSPEFIGTREVDQAGVLEAQRRQSSLNLLASLFNSLRRYRKRQGKILLHLIQNYLADGRLIRIVGDSKSEYVPLMRSNIADVRYDIIIDDAPNSPNEKERTWGILQQMLPLLKDMITPDMIFEIAKYTPLPATLIDQWMKKLKEQQEAEASQPPQPSPDEIKMQAEMQKHQMNMQAKQVDIEAKHQAAATKQQTDAVSLFVDQQKAQLELETAQQKAEIEMVRVANQAAQTSIRQQNANTRRGDI
ncbi:phage portal protein [Paenochrobactrum glaciei]|uniref:Phage portal protein n=1 Tax=Paenochrobactrum glaciei TaxID=486407 RepID=A0ABN1GKE3_9HYPH